MTLFFHELKRDRVKLIVWTAVIAFMLLINVVLYPQMISQMGEMNDMLNEMEGLSAAFNMNKVDMRDFNGYFALESGSSIGLGGAFFAALLGIAALSKEERDRTAEFLLTHPVTRNYVVTQKLAAVIAEILILNLVVFLLNAAAGFAIGEKIDGKLWLQLFLAFSVLMIEIACIMFGVSAFLRRNGLGIGLGASFVLYFMSLLANLTEEAEFLKYITPFSYADGAEIAGSGGIEMKYLLPGVLLAAAGVAAAFLQYNRKDIRA